jgi:calcium channel MID1
MASTLLYLFGLLLPLASIYGQTTSEHALALNSLSSFSGSSSPTLFTLPSSDTLSVSVALCASTSSPPLFYVANDTTDATEIVLWQGFGNWTGPAPSGGMLKVENIGSNSFEIGVSDDGKIVHYSIYDYK